VGSPLHTAARINSVFPALTYPPFVAAPVRARRAGFRPEKPGLYDPHRRAVDCAPYRLSAFLL